MSDHEIVALVHTTRMYFFRLTLFSRHYFLWQVVVAPWSICSQRGLLGATSSTNHTPYCFMRDSIILSTFSHRFLLFKNTVQHSLYG
jgi:hypothetical protein